MVIAKCLKPASMTRLRHNASTTIAAKSGKRGGLAR